MIEREEHWPTDEALILHAVKIARGPRKGARWVAVMETFGVGSSVAWWLCKRAGADPEEMVRAR